jgi:hypothetical protein
LGAEHSDLLAANQCLLAGPNRDLVSILQWKLLQPNHFESLEALKQAILDFIGYYNQTAKAIRWSYTVEKLEEKLGVN